MCPDEWCAVDENGRSCGVETRLGAYRNIFNKPLHRGVHPEKSKMPNLVKAFLDNRDRAAYGYRLYWFEK